MTLPFTLDCEPPFLILRFAERQETLGWSISSPGFAVCDNVVWLEVHDADLAAEVDPRDMLKRRLSAKSLDGALAFLTARHIRRHHVAQSRVGEILATCVTTVGLSNGERVGTRRHSGVRKVGTINTLVHLSCPLSVGAFVEAVSIVAQARTAALIETSHLREGPAVTGTGTDCIIVAAPQRDGRELYAGLHTAAGEAMGAAVHAATLEGARQWSEDIAVLRQAPVR